MLASPATVQSVHMYNLCLNSRVDINMAPCRNRLQQQLQCTVNVARGSDGVADVEISRGTRSTCQGRMLLWTACSRSKRAQPGIKERPVPS